MKQHNVKKNFISFMIFAIALLFLFGASIFTIVDFAAPALASASSGGEREIFQPEPTQLSDLQAAGRDQLDYWAANLTKFDGREFDYITKEKNQGGLGICWAYAAVGAMEANILRDGVDPDVDKTSLDLDEIIAAYVRYNRDGENDPLYLTSNDTYSVEDWRTCGGHADDAFLAMSQGFSPDEQKTSEGYRDWAIKQRISQSKYFVQGYKQIDNTKEAIKRAILEYGSVTMEYKAPQTITQTYLYHSDGTSLGHASIIIGWDDNVSKNRFWPGSPSSDGAWIVKNSWGPGGEQVNETYCFYLSYDSFLSKNLFVVDMGLREDYQNIYYYDGHITDNGIQYYADSYAAIYGAKLSSASEREQLVAVSFGVRNRQLTADIKVYKLSNVNFGNVNDKINEPDVGILIGSKENVYFEDDGFYTVDFDEPIDLEQGECFSIVISGTDTGGNLLNPVFAVDNIESVNDMTYRKYGGVWTSFKGDSGTYADNAAGICVRLRALTNTVPRDTILENDLEYARVELSDRFTYYERGVPQMPEVTVYFGDKILQEGEDYLIAYEQNASPGKAFVKIVGINEFDGERKVDFEVAKPKYPPGAITQTIEVYSDITRLHQIKLPEGWKWSDNDYTLELGMSSFSHAMKYTGEDADCYRSSSYSVHILKHNENRPSQIDIAGATVTVEGKYVYSGAQIIPKVQVVCQGHLLTIDEDFTLECSENTAAGTATVSVIGKGSYSGQNSRTFVIKKAKWPEKRPSGTIRVGEDITVLGQIGLNCAYWFWLDNTQQITENVFTAIAVYSGTDMGNFVNTKMPVTIIRGEQTVQKNIADIDLLQLDETSFTYDGEAKTPGVVATDGGITLVNGDDFTATYSNNVEAGQGKVTVRGKHNYFGSKILVFTIAKADRKAFKVVQSNWTYGDTAPLPVAEGQMEQADITYKYSADTGGNFTTLVPTNAGSYFIKAEIAESDNYNAAEATAQFDIFKASYPSNMPATGMTVDRKAKTLRFVALISGWDWVNPDVAIDKETVVAWAEYYDKVNFENYRVRITITKAPPKNASELNVRLAESEFTYDGLTKTPAVIAMDGAFTLALGYDYDVQYRENKFAGQGVAKVSFKNDYTGVKELTFTIAKAKAPNVDTTLRPNKKASKLSDIELPKGFVWEEENMAVTTDAFTAKALYIGEDAENYETKEVCFSVVFVSNDLQGEKQTVQEQTNLIWIAIVAAVAVLIGATVIFIVARHKRRNVRK